MWFAYNGGQECVLHGSSSGTGLAAESHFLSGTSSSVCRFTQIMTLCWKPIRHAQNGQSCFSRVFALTPHNQRRETSHHAKRQTEVYSKVNMQISSGLFRGWPLPQEAEHCVRPPLLHTNGSWVSGGRSVRGGIRAFLLGADPRCRVLSGVQRSEDGWENTDEEEDEEEGEEWEGKEGPEIGGEAGGGSSIDTVRGPGKTIKRQTWMDKLDRTGRAGGWERNTRRREEWKVKEGVNAKTVRTRGRQWVTG